MLLVDDDQAKILKRQEQRGPCANDETGTAFGHHLPDPAAFGHRDARVPFGRPRAEPCFDPGQEFCRQGDLRKQNQGLPPGLQAFGDGFQINLGLARAGHAQEKERRERFAIDGLGGTDTLFNIEEVRGSENDDVLIGDSGNNAFRGVGGDDTIFGGDGIDRVDMRSTGNTEGAVVNLAAGIALDGQGGTATIRSSAAAATIHYKVVTATIPMS